MTAIAQTSGIRERIFPPLLRVRGRQWVMRAARAGMQWLLVSLGVWLAVALLLGSLTNLPAILRVVLSAIALVSLVASAFLFLPPAFHRRKLSDVAQDVEKTLPHAHNCSAAPSNSPRNPTPVSPPRRSCWPISMRQAEEAAKAVKPKAVVSFRSLPLGRRPRRW